MARTASPLISDGQARNIACQWHGDVSRHPATLAPIRVDRAVNVFASTGEILPGLAAEIETLLPGSHGIEQSPGERAFWEYDTKSDVGSAVEAWLQYVRAIGVRPPQPGWYRLG